jgi:hypothetical protein
MGRRQAQSSYESVLRDFRALSPNQRRRFCAAICRGHDCPHAEVLDHILSAVGCLVRDHHADQRDKAALAAELRRRVPKARNAERDAEILRLRAEDPENNTGKALAKMFKMSHGAVRQVFWRDRHKNVTDASVRLADSKTPR